MTTRALIIDEPWISKILSGEKTWEMRSTSATTGERIALVRKGSGRVVGVATIASVEGPMPNERLLDTFGHHRVPRDVMELFSEFKWRFAWKLTGVTALAEPVAYQHPNGAVIWVRLSDEVAKKIDGQLADSAAADKDTELSKGNIVESESQQSTTNPFRVLELTQGNIDNNHIYLRSLNGWIPARNIGGPNRKSLAQQSMTVHWGGTEPAETDIAGDKMIFRKRSWLSQIFQLHGLRSGDEVRITRIGDDEYRLSPNRD